MCAGIPPSPPPRADAPLGADAPTLEQTPPGNRHPPEADTPLGAEPPTPDQTPPAGADTPREQRRLLLRTVRILLECIPVEKIHLLP